MSGFWAARGEEKYKEVLSRFEVKVKKGTHCWRWIAGDDGCDGYGKFKFEGKKWRAHRMSWLLYNGDIPGCLCVLHKCDNPSCVNPRHLFLGTKLENAEDRDKKTRRTPAKGEGNGRSKLREDDICKIRIMRTWGFTYKDLGVAFGVEDSTIYCIIKGTTWRHV